MNSLMTMPIETPLRHLEEQAARDEDYRKGDEAEEKRPFQLVQYKTVKSPDL